MSYLVTTPLKLHKRGGDGGVLVVLVYQGGLPLDRCELEQHLAIENHGDDVQLVVVVAHHLLVKLNPSLKNAN